MLPIFNFCSDKLLEFKICCCPLILSVSLAFNSNSPLPDNEFNVTPIVGDIKDIGFKLSTVHESNLISSFL